MYFARRLWHIFYPKEKKTVCGRDVCSSYNRDHVSRNIQYARAVEICHGRSTSAPRYVFAVLIVETFEAEKTDEERKIMLFD